MPHRQGKDAVTSVFAFYNGGCHSFCFPDPNLAINVSTSSNEPPPPFTNERPDLDDQKLQLSADKFHRQPQEQIFNFIENVSLAESEQSDILYFMRVYILVFEKNQVIDLIFCGQLITKIATRLLLLVSTLFIINFYPPFVVHN